MASMSKRTVTWRPCKGRHLAAHVRSQHVQASSHWRWMRRFATSARRPTNPSLPRPFMVPTTAFRSLAPMSFHGARMPRCASRRQTGPGGFGTGLVHRSPHLDHRRPCRLHQEQPDPGTQWLGQTHRGDARSKWPGAAFRQRDQREFSFRPRLGRKEAIPNTTTAPFSFPNPRRFGETVGWIGFAALSDEELQAAHLNISGYPGDKPAGTQWYDHRVVDSVSDRKVVLRHRHGRRSERQRCLPDRQRCPSFRRHSRLWRFAREFGDPGSTVAALRISSSGIFEWHDPSAGIAHHPACSGGRQSWAADHGGERSLQGGARRHAGYRGAHRRLRLGSFSPLRHRVAIRLKRRPQDFKAARSFSTSARGTRSSSRWS